MRTGLLSLVMLSGCFALTDTDRFEADEGCDLELRLRDFNPHATNPFIVRLVQAPSSESPGAPRQLFVAQVDELRDADVDFRFPGAVLPLLRANQPRPSIDFFADFNEDGQYTAPPVDHTWRIEDACTGGPEEFLHNTDFLDLPDPTKTGDDRLITNSSALGLRVCGLPPRLGDAALELRISQLIDGPELLGTLAEEFRPVAFLRRQSLNGVEPENLLFEGAVDDGERYRVEVVIDADRNYLFDESIDEARIYEYDPDTAEACPAVCPGTSPIGMNPTFDICRREVEGQPPRLFIYFDLNSDNDGQPQDEFWMRAVE